MAEMLVKDINGRIKENAAAFVKECENAYHGMVSALAERVCTDGRVKIIMLAGPSGSGKTTTANLLSDYIKDHGCDCMVVSLDDFYRDANDPEYPRFENGERNFEAVEALDLPELNKTLTAIASSVPFTVPKYDFKVGGRTEMRSYPAMTHGCVVIEGLHALNPLVFGSLPEDKVIKLFISVSTNIIKDDKRILSGRKIRFMRRMIRDYLYRNATAQRTLDFWDGVLFGEDTYLYPTRKYADVSFNTFHPFELSVMRPFVESLVSEELAEKSPYAATVLKAVREIEPMDIDLVPDDSLIREFIPGGKYEALY